LSVKPDAEGPEELDALARSAGGGDERAFERLVRRVHTRIHRWALVRVADPDDAEDITQAVLIKLHASLDGWEGRGKFTTWLYRVTANEASTWRRRIARRARWMVRDPAAREAALNRWIGPAPDDDRDELVELIRRYFLDLPPRQREVFDLVEFQGYAPAEVGEMLEMNPNTVRANLFKARQAIRRRAEDHREVRT
jgi:RNA polymerase sigma-70 factor (ECF subfamily)